MGSSKKENEMKFNIEKQGYIVFTGEITVKENYMDFEVKKITGWDKLIPIEREHYLSGDIKWDGCTNVNFGLNYFHFCEPHDFDDMNYVLHFLYQKAVELEVIAEQHDNDN